MKNHPFGRETMSHSPPAPTRRQAVASVEFAIIAPVFALVAMGVCEITHMLDVKTDLTVVVREGARMASFDREGFIPPGGSTNDKIIGDVRNLLNANGLPGDIAAITISQVGSPGMPFNLDDPLNEWQLFELRIQIPYGGLTNWYEMIGGPDTIEAFIVFQNGRPRQTS
jgi:hypothetical protein